MKRILFAYALVIWTACTGERGPSGGPTPSGARSTLTVDWKIGGEGDRLFRDSIGDVRMMAVAPDGRVVAWDPLAPAIWVVSADGTALTRVGRKGEGPGEFLRIDGLTFLDDGRLVAWDGKLKRISFYSARGVFERSVPTPPQAPEFPSGLSMGEGSRLWLRGTLRAARSVTTDLREAWFGMDTSFARMDTVDTELVPDNFRLTAQRVVNGQARVSMQNGVPYAPVVVHALDRSGTLWTADGARYAIRSTRDTSIARIQRDYEPVPISPDERAVLRAEYTGFARSVQPDWAWTAIDIPEFKPPVRRLDVDSDNRLWVSLSVLSDSGPRDKAPPHQRRFRPLHTLWDVFEANGAYLGRVTGSRDFTFFSARGNDVWGIQRDDDGVVAIVKAHTSDPLALRR